jgi:hypothetical protein
VPDLFLFRCYGEQAGSGLAEEIPRQL